MVAAKLLLLASCLHRIMTAYTRSSISSATFCLLAAFILVVLRRSDPSVVFAFQFPHRKCLSHIRPETLHHYPSLSTLFSANENDDDKRLLANEYKKRLSYRKGHRRRRWRKLEKFIHQQNESHVTAAGAESLFSLSWWPPFSYYKKVSSATSTSSAATTDNTFFSSSDHLPSIDCGWACVSNTEKIQLQQMKLLLHSEMKAITNNNLHEIYPDVYSDLRLLRFLRKSKERDIVSAVERYRSFLKWRELNGVDRIRAMIEEGNKISSSDSSSSFRPTDKRLQAVAAYFPMNFDFVVQEMNESMKGENPAVKPAILYIGQFDTRGITEKILAPDSEIVLEDFLNYWIFLYESIHVTLYKQSIQTGQMVYLDEVCDLSGLSLQQFSPSFVTKVMNPWLKMTQANYPETTRRIYVLHPPAIVKVAWKLVTPLLSQGTIDKIGFVRKFDGSADEFVKSGASEIS